MSRFDKRSVTDGAASAEPRTIHTDKAPGRSPAADGSAKASADAAVNRALAGAGSGTPHASGATFHDDAVSHSAADALGANAFTAGSDVYFGAGQYNPGSAAGSALIQHELTHVDQGRGVEPARPGNFRVSSPGDAAEVAARAGASGASAAPGTIHREGEGTPTTTGQATPTGGDTPTTDPAPPTEDTGGTTANPYDEWKAACQGFDTAQAVAKWATVPGTDKARVAGEGGAFHRRMITTMGKDSVQVIKEGGLDVAELAYYIFAQSDFADYLAPMRTHGVLNTFLAAEPLTTHLGPAQTAKLKTWVDAAANVTEAKRIFHKAYPTLHDTSPSPVSFGGTAAAWPLARVKRLFTVLAEYLSPGHASTVTGGFVYVTSPLFGWWNSGHRRVWLPASSESTGHNMSGGQSRGHKATDTANAKGQVTSPTGRSVSPDFTAPDGTAKTGGAATMGHFTGTIIHEVGHGVGDRVDGGRGNAYALNSGSWPGFNTNMSFDTWANELWVNGATGSGTEPAVHRNAKLDDSHAKDFLKSEIKDGKGSYSPGWTSNPPRADMATYVKWRYASVPLQKWWDYMVERGLDKGGSYAWDDESARLRNGWCYAFLTRGGSNYTKFKAAAWNQKVSWYSLSSPKEWFAEQYTHFYRTQKTGPGIDSATLALLSDLDKKEFVPTSGGDGVTITDSSRGGGGGEGGTIDDAGSSETAAETSGGEDQEQGAQPGDEPLMFPW